MMTEKEQKKNLEEYFERKLTTDETFIVEWIYAGFNKEVKKLTSMIEEGVTFEELNNPDDKINPQSR